MAYATELNAPHAVVLMLPQGHGPGSRPGGPVDDVQRQVFPGQ
ncbi:MAG: hypothetical protein WKG07_21245 [Hymenobacter sp.]